MATPTTDPLDLWDSDSSPMYIATDGIDWTMTSSAKKLLENPVDEFAPGATSIRRQWLTTATSTTPTLAIITICAENAVGFGLNPDNVDWDRFYEMLEILGWDMQDLGGTVDNRIRRLVNRARREGEMQ